MHLPFKTPFYPLSVIAQFHRLFDQYTTLRFFKAGKHLFWGGGGGLFLAEGGKEYRCAPTRGNSLLSLALDNTSIPLYTKLLNKKCTAACSLHVF